MAKSTDKRRSRLEHVKKDHMMFLDVLEDIDEHSNLRSGITPEYLKNLFIEQGNRICIAEEYVDTPEGEDLVHGVDSAQAEVAMSFALPGMRTASGGWETSSRALLQVDHEQWKSLAKNFVRSEPKPLRRGWKSRVSKEVAKKCDANFETVRKRLGKMGVWDDFES